MKNQLLCMISVLALAHLPSCGGNSGDHIPDGKTYLVNKLPSGATNTGIVPQELSLDIFQRFVRLAEHYNVCVSKEQVDETALANFNKRLKFKADNINESGLESVLNQAFVTIRRYKAERTDFSSRIEINVIYPHSGNCDLVIAYAPRNSFPFESPDYSDQKYALFQNGQLKDNDKDVNTIPVAYIRNDLSSVDASFFQELTIATFVGLGSSHKQTSRLNSKTANTDTASYLLTNKDGSLQNSDDVLIVYGFALVYQDVLKPKDLARLHYYADELGLNEESTDPEALFTGNYAAIPFKSLPGAARIDGVRKVADTVKVCFEGASAHAIQDAWLPSYLNFASWQSEPRPTGSLFYELHKKEDSFKAIAQVAQTDCNLLVLFRNSSQYPFNKYLNNGLYSREGRVKDKDGNTSSIPLIYINASDLTLDPTAATTNTKYVGDVLQHEFAHFMGLRHSASTHSVMSPSGYNTTWDINGDDGLAFDEWLENWRQF